MWGRFALALVSARAGKCPQMKCRRNKRCLARFGPKDNFHTEAGNCPIMSGVEWRSVSLGIRGNWSLLGPWQAALRDKRDQEEAERVKKMSREEKLRQRAEGDATKARREKDGEPVREYALMLWVRIVDGRPMLPCDLAGAGERLIAWRLGLGCRCAAAGTLECEDVEECFRRTKGEGGEAGLGSGAPAAPA